MLPESRLARFLENATQTGGVDFHLHSHFSDGAQSPGDLVDEVLEKKLLAFSLTDHDTMGGIAQARDALRRRQPRARDASDYRPDEWTILGGGPWFVPGVECSAQFEGQEVHLLGYFAKIDPPEMTTYLKKQADERTRRNEAMIRKLNTLGYPITSRDLRRFGIAQTMRGRVHIALWLVENADFTSIEEAFQVLLNEGRPAYVQREKHSVEEVADVIARSGGVAVLAHPQKYGWCENRDAPETIQSLKRRFSSCQSMGVAGVECYHGQANKEESRFMSDLASELGMICTAGSDSHGRDDHHGQMYDGETCCSRD
ncbi:MAG TPA: PHP domain-containing protein [Clostridia bacterium]|nr:PHP domain-containing protein [Clostridia bacterium]